MKFKDITLDEFNIMGFIAFDSNDYNNEVVENVEISSWGDEDENICPHCGEVHDLKTHNELNWEDQYPTHSLLKKNLSLILEDESNIVNKDKKYEIIKFDEDINDETFGYNLVGLRVFNLNIIPPHFIGMRFPKKRYKSTRVSMGEFMSSAIIDEQIHSDELDDYFIIEYDLGPKIEFSKIIVTIYYPIKE